MFSPFQGLAQEGMATAVSGDSPDQACQSAK